MSHLSLTGSQKPPCGHPLCFQNSRKQWTGAKLLSKRHSSDVKGHLNANRTLKHPETQFGPQDKLLTRRTHCQAGGLLGANNHPLGPSVLRNNVAKGRTRATWRLKRHSCEVKGHLIANRTLKHPEPLYSLHQTEVTRRTDWPT